MFKRSQKGIGLLELILAFTIIVVLLGMVLRYYTATKSANSLALVKEQKTYIDSAFTRWADMQNPVKKIDAASIDQLSALLPTDDVDSTNKTISIVNVTPPVYLKSGTQVTDSDQFVLIAVLSKTATEATALDSGTCHLLGMAFVGSPTGQGSGETGDGCNATDLKFQYTVTRLS